MKHIIRMKGTALLASLYLSVATPVTAGDAEANALLVEAVQLIQASQADVAAEEKLRALNEALSKLQEIVSEHPSSGLAVSLVTGQKIGTLDQAELRAEQDRLMGLVAEKEAAQRKRDEEARKHEAWVVEMMECAESLDCVDAFTAELLGRPLSAPPGSETAILDEFYEYVIAGSTDPDLQLPEEQLTKFEREGFDREETGASGYLRRLALAGDPRFLDFLLEGTDASSLNDWVVQSAENWRELYQNRNTVVIHTVRTEGASAGLSQVVEMRAELTEAIARYRSQLSESDQDSITTQRAIDKIESLTRATELLTVDSLAVFAVSILRGDIAKDDAIVRASLEMMLDELGLASDHLADDYVHAVLYLASYVIRLEQSPNGSAPMFSPEGQKDKTSVEESIAACRPEGVVIPINGVTGKFELVNEAGETIRFGEALTGPALVYFGYSNDAGVSPMDLARNAQAVDLLEEQGHLVTPIMISVDPNRDTPRRLADFTGAIHPRLVGLTGSPDQISKASNEYRVFYRADSPGADGNYRIDHSTFTYVVLPELGIVDYIRRDETAEEVAALVSCLVAATQ